MSWLFWVLMILFVLCVIQGFRKGLIRTAISMVFFIIVIVVASWLNPYVSNFIREKTSWQETIQERCSEALFQSLDKQVELPVSTQVEFIEELPLPQNMKDKLIENNNAEMYRKLAVEGFSDYLSGYVAYGIMNGIAFLISFVIAIIIIKLILYAVDILTELPGVGTLNRIGGLFLGGVQGILWIWIFFLVVTLVCDTPAGAYLMKEINQDVILQWFYDQNYLMQIIMRILV